MNSNKEELEKLFAIGLEVSNSIIKYFKDDNNSEEVKELFNLGINIRIEKKINILNKKTFLFTGSLGISRNKIENLIRKLGGKILATVSSNLDYLIVGKNPGIKLKKAQALDIKIINEEEVLKLLKM